MLILQAVTLCLTLCIFGLQAQYWNGEATGSENNPYRTLNEKWQSYGCENSYKLTKPFGKLELCLETLANQMILRILQNYSLTPLPEHLIIVDGKRGFEDQIRKYIETYMPQVGADRKILGDIFEQIYEFIFKPMIRYINQFPMDVTVPVKLDLDDSRREEIANFLKKYMNDQDSSKLPEEEYNKIVSKITDLIDQYRNRPDGFKVVLPYSLQNFQSFKPWLFTYIKNSLPDLYADKPLLQKFLKQIEDIFEGVKRKSFTPDNINGLDKNTLLQFVKTYYPKLFDDQDFIAKLVENYEAQPKLTVMPTSEPDYNQIKNFLLHFFNNVYPKLSIDKQFVDQFAKNFKPAHGTSVELTVAMPELDTISPTREEILDYVQKQMMNSTIVPNNIQLSNDESGVQINAQLIPIRRDITLAPTNETLSSEVDPESITSPISDTLSQDRTPPEDTNIRQKILNCIKEASPRIYADKPLLVYLLNQLQYEILPKIQTSPMNVENQIRRFVKEHEPKITVKQTDLPESNAIEIDISSETEHSAPTVNVVNPGDNVIEIDITPPETKESREPVKKVYMVKGNGNAAKVSLSTGKQNPDAVVNVQVSGSSNQNTNKDKIIKFLNNINIKPKNQFAKNYKTNEEKYRNLYKNLLKSIGEIGVPHNKNYKPFKIEMPKLVQSKVTENLKPATAMFNDRLSEYITNNQKERLDSIQFPYERSFFPLIIQSYGPLYEKEHRGEPLTTEERMKMNILETTFANYKPFRQLYLKKFGPQDKLGIKTMLYNMYKLDLKENDGKLVQIDPLKNIKFPRMNNPNFKLFNDEHDEKHEETIKA